MLSIDTLQSFESGTMKGGERILKNYETLQFARSVQNTSSAEIT